MDDIINNLDNTYVDKINIGKDYISDEDYNSSDNEDTYMDEDEVDSNKERADISKYIEISKYFLNKLNFKKNTDKDDKKLIKFYKKVYEKIIVYNKNINFNFDHHIYKDLTKDAKKEFNILKIYLKSMHFDMINLRRQKKISKIKNKSGLKNIIKFYSQLQNILKIESNDYSNDIEIIENLISIL